VTSQLFHSLIPEAVDRAKLLLKLILKGRNTLSMLEERY